MLMGVAAAAVLVAAMAAATGDGASLSQQLPGCQARCGQVEIPYPFGIGNSSSTGASCSRRGLGIGCVKDGGGGLVPVLEGLTLRVMSLSATTPRAQARVMLSAGSRCYNLSGAYARGNEGRFGLSNDPAAVYRISDAANELVVLGCDTYVQAMSGKNMGPGGSNKYYAGCVSYCSGPGSAQDGVCSGVGCCRLDLPGGAADNMWIFGNRAGGDYSHFNMSFAPCDYAFLVEKGHYVFRASDLVDMPINQTMPLVLDWAIRDAAASPPATFYSCADAPNKPGYACVSNHSVCVDSVNGPGYMCNCSGGYEGNPYLADGCTDIDECSRLSDFHCNGKCINTDGSYDCKCYPGYYSVNDDAKHNPCNPKFSTAAKLSLGITLGVSFLIVALLSTLVMLQKKRLDDLYKKNGGKELENVKGLTIFTKDELKKITRNNSEFLGKGSFGKVYKGTLPDNTVVAVKASIKVKEETRKDFIKEVELQTQMIHKNILKLFGCCLHVEVPMLVYEFAAKGSLQDILHGKREDHDIPLDMRLDVAIGCAEGFRYMHSYTSQTIRHGDVKPDNILLAENLVPKISDFGLAMLLDKKEYFAKTVVGCMGYIDPMFLKSGMLTQKSDVYSFGAVLLELITRKPNVYDDNRSLIFEFCKAFEKDKSGRAMFDKDIADTDENIFVLEEIAKLAIECLKEDITERPDMTEVAEQLVMIRRNRKHGVAQNSSPRHFEEIILTDSLSTGIGSATSTLLSKHLSGHP